jgi:hypothetical protein
MDPRLEKLIELLRAALARERELGDLSRDFQQKVERAKKIEELRKLALEFAQRLIATNGLQQEALQEALGLAEELGKALPPPPPDGGPVRADDVARHFRTLIDNIQLDARKPRAGEVATTLKSLDVEIKGLIVVEKNEARIVTPAPGRPVDPGQLSTIRMSFGTIPVLPQTEEPKPTEPPK